ncbi:SHOCT domain-containing protein [Halorussus litoreus]|uniref:SHOCT domain-containing protein n=1 Tax=Halorussus litoreus TaxID=1710536 RepID=UPI0018E5828C|nr:SHOCT domain-containing protein [Halorussus litoreus]
MTDPADPSDESALVKLTALLVLGLGLTTLFLGYGWFWMVFAVGFAVAVPLVKLATDELGLAGASTPRSEGSPDSMANRHADSRSDARADHRRADAPRSKQDALDALRTRYAQGELDEMEFERKVEKLLETETLEGARDRVAERRDGDSPRRESATAEAAARERDGDPATER